MERIDVKKHLPFGVALREILQHPSLSGTNLKQLLRQRGVFIESNEDNVTIPLLTTTLISTNQFEFIKERIKSKEDREKWLTRSIDWHSNKSLISTIPADLDVGKLISEAFPKLKLVNATPFTMIDGDSNKIKMDFRCQTNNYNSSWYRTRSEFGGQLTLEKVETKDEVRLRIKYTSPETHQIGDKIVKKLEQTFKDQKLTKAAEMDKIIYKNFTNEQRIAFFLALADGNHIFTFDRTTNMDIAPDPNEALPDNFAWMEESKVKELNINGDQLHNSPFLNDKANFRFVELAELEVFYKFSYHAAEGTCRIKFGFENYLHKRLTNIEFSVDLTKLTLYEDYAHVNKENVRNYLLEEFDKLKVENYNLHKYQNLAQQQFNPD